MPGPDFLYSTTASNARLGGFARVVNEPGSVADRMQRGVELAVELLPGCDHAGVTMASGRRLVTAAASDDVVRRGDALQYELDEGPCLDTVHTEHTIISQSLALDPRWHTWSARVGRELGVRAMMSLLLYTGTDSYGALNLYADQTDVWDDRQVDLGLVIAGQLAVAASNAVEIDRHEHALRNRTTIGQAQGLLMERYGLDPERALALLASTSQSQHLQLAQIAEQLVATRELPSPAAPSARL